MSTWIQSPFGGGGGTTLALAVTGPITTAYTAKQTDYLIECDASVSGAFTVTLPTSSITTGTIFVVKKIDGGSNQVAVQPATGTFESSLGSATLFFVGDWVMVMWDGTTWRFLAGLQYIFSLRTRDTVLDDGAGNIQLFKAGSTLAITEGSNCKQGTATANGTTAVVVSTTAVTANSRIYLTAQNPNAGAPGALYVSAISAGTSFSFKSTSGTDASTVAWLIIEHT